MLTRLKKELDTGLISGITTNPTLILRSGRKPRDVYRELNDLDYITDVSMEVTANTALHMYNIGIELSDSFENATIKLPVLLKG